MFEPGGIQTREQRVKKIHCCIGFSFLEHTVSSKMTEAAIRAASVIHPKDVRSTGGFKTLCFDDESQRKYAALRW